MVTSACILKRVSRCRRKLLCQAEGANTYWMCGSIKLCSIRCQQEIFGGRNFRELVFDRAKIVKISRCTVWNCNTWCTPSQSCGMNTLNGCEQMIYMGYFTMCTSMSFCSQIWHCIFVWIERQAMITAFTFSVLQVQQLYTAGIPLLEAYCQWPFSELAKSVSPRTKWPLAQRGPDSYACVFSAK